MKVEKVIGNEGVVVSQTPEADEILTEPETVTIQIGESQAAFIEELMAAINNKRAANGMGSLTLSGAWSAAAQSLANSGHTSGEFQNGYEYSWAIFEQGLAYSYCFWATREGITTVDDAISKLPWTDAALLRSGVTTVGIGFNGKRICMLIASPR